MIHYYRKLLAENERIKTFYEGIQSVVKPGCTVVEIGTGLGTYSFFASMAGARKVYALEDGQIAETARELYAQNRHVLGDIQFIPSHSFLVDLPEKADVVIFENFLTLGISPQEERIIIDARTRFLAPDGVFAPGKMELFWVPLCAREIWENEVACLGQTEIICGLDFGQTRPTAINQPAYTVLDAERTLCQAKSLVCLDFLQFSELQFVKKLTFELGDQSTLHGFGCYMDLIFPNNRFSSAFGKPATTFSRAFFPLPEPITVQKGDCVDMNVSVFPGPAESHTWSWWGKICNSEGNVKSTFKLSTVNSITLMSHDTTFPAEIRDDTKPVLTAEGNMRKLVLTAMDGEKTVEEIALMLCESFPEQATSLAWAKTKVLRIVKKCAC